MVRSSVTLTKDVLMADTYQAPNLEIIGLVTDLTETTTTLRDGSLKF